MDVGYLTASLVSIRQALVMFPSYNHKCSHPLPSVAGSLGVQNCPDGGSLVQSHLAELVLCLQMVLWVPVLPTASRLPVCLCLHGVGLFSAPAPPQLLWTVTRCWRWWVAGHPGASLSMPAPGLVLRPGAGKLNLLGILPVSRKRPQCQALARTTVALSSCRGFSVSPALLRSLWGLT